MKLTIKIIVKSANKEVKLFCATRVQELTIWSVSNLNWKRLQRVAGLVPTVKEKVIIIDGMFLGN